MAAATAAAGRLGSHGKTRPDEGLDPIPTRHSPSIQQRLAGPPPDKPRAGLFSFALPPPPDLCPVHVHRLMDNPWNVLAKEEGGVRWSCRCIFLVVFGDHLYLYTRFFLFSPSRRRAFDLLLSSHRSRPLTVAAMQPRLPTAGCSSGFSPSFSRPSQSFFSLQEVP